MQMADLSQIQEHMEIIGADGVHIGTVDKVEGNRIKMTKADSGSHSDRYRPYCWKRKRMGERWATSASNRAARWRGRARTASPRTPRSFRMIAPPRRAQNR
jgi:hypothetical protein